MNSWQASLQAKHQLLKQAWPDSPFGNVFAQVFCTQTTAEDCSGSLRFPFAIVRVLDAQFDPDDQRYNVQKFEVVSCVNHTGSQVGESGLIGGNRQSQGTSGGRGLLEVEEQVLNALEFLNQTNAFRIQLVGFGAAEAGNVEGMGYVVARALTFQARLTTERDYPTPNAGKALPNSAIGTAITLTWTFHDRFDCRNAYPGSQLQAARGKLVLRRASGSTPPATITSGTNIPLSAAVATTVTDNPGHGTWSYSLFAQYDEYGNGTGSPVLTGTSVRNSTAATVAGIVV